METVRWHTNVHIATVHMKCSQSDMTSLHYNARDSLTCRETHFSPCTHTHMQIAVFTNQHKYILYRCWYTSLCTFNSSKLRSEGRRPCWWQSSGSSCYSDSVTKKEGNPIAMDTLSQGCDLGEGDGVGVFEGMRAEWRAFCIQWTESDKAWQRMEPNYLVVKYSYCFSGMQP